MNKLLLANVARLKKDKVFWIGMIFMFVTGILIVINNRQNIDSMHLENVFFSYIVIIGILAAAFGSLFIGTEYSDGTIRNKLMIGHTRSSIYLANFIICIIANLCMSVSYMIAVSIFGIPMFGFFHTDIKIILTFLLCATIVTIAFSSIFLFLSMLNQNKAMTAVISMIGIVAIFCLAIDINLKLQAPEFYPGYIFTDSLGKITEDHIPNPSYLRGSARTMYQFFLDFLPTGQSLQIASMEGKNLLQMSLYSILITIVMLVSGICCFRKKDLK